MSTQSKHNIQKACPYTKSMKIQSRHKPLSSPCLYSPYLSPPLATKHQKGRRSYSWGGEDGVDWLGAAMKRSVSSSEETVGVTGVVGGGAEELGGVEDATASMTTLVASVKGADETGTVSAEEGQTAVGRIGSKVSVVTGRD